MKQFGKKLLVFLLVISMVISLLPVSAFAEAGTTEPKNVETLEGLLPPEEEEPTSTPEETSPTDLENTPAPEEPLPAAVTNQPEDPEGKGDEALPPSDGSPLGNGLPESLEQPGDGEGTEKVIDKDTREVSDGTYYIKGSFTNNNRLEIKGNVIIELEDGCEATFNNGIHVPRDVSLTIEGNGSLTAKGSRDDAGIGGNLRETAGKITIKSGTVRAAGGGFAAGIGGGYKGGGGTITISGGRVTAIGGGVLDRIGGAGIGGGLNGGNGADLTITGGFVRATGGGNCSAIGRGMGSPLNSMGSLNLGPELNVLNVVNDNAATRIDDPTPQKLNGIKKVAIGYLITDVQTVKGLTYNDKEQDGRVDPNQQHTIFEGTLSAVYPETYTFTATPEEGYMWADGTGTQKTYTWKIAPKDVSSSRPPVKRIISKGIGIFTPPGDFYDAETDKDIPGTLTYTYGGRQMTQNQVEEELALLPVGATGRFDWMYAADGNFTGTIRGSIFFTIRRIVFTVDGKPADEKNAVMIKENPTYGDNWAEIVTIKSDKIIVSLGDRKGIGRYFLNVSGRPGASDNQEYAVLFTGIVGGRIYRNVTVFTGTVNVAKADYDNVTKETSAQLNAAKGSTVTVTLPAIPKGAGYGTPVKTNEADPYTLSSISGKQLTVTSEGIPDGTSNMQFTVPVTPDSNHKGYTITVTLIPKAHKHNFRYIAIGNVMIAVCSVPGCPLTEDVRLTLTAPENLKYDDKAKEVTFANGEAEAWKAATGEDAPSITYTADRGSTLTDGKPVKVGSYTASINVNGSRARASLRFSIVLSRPKVTVKVDSGYIGVIPFYTATINVEPMGKVIKQVEHSTNGFFYTEGNQMISLSPITHFYIRVTTDDDKSYIYEYRNGKIIER